jgi:hypothetical protein
LENKPLLFVPYPNSERLKNLLDNPTIRGILPGNIYANNSRQPIGKDGEPYCNQAPLVHAFRVAKWDHDSADPEFAWDTSVTQNRWQGTDFFRSKIQGFHIFGSFINSETDTGIITLQVSRGQKILYRSGSRVAGQFLLVNGSGPNKFYTALPLAIEWAILEFYGDELPDQFSVSLVDAGTKWGEWSAIALRSVDDR